MKMFTAMSADLEALGIPFFGTKPELVYPADRNSTKSNAEEKGRSNGQRLAGGRVDADADREILDGQGEVVKKLTKDELVKLQRKMIQHLGDMYNE